MLGWRVGPPVGQRVVLLNPSIHKHVNEGILWILEPVIVRSTLAFLILEKLSAGDLTVLVESAAIVAGSRHGSILSAGIPLVEIG